MKVTETREKVVEYAIKVNCHSTALISLMNYVILQTVQEIWRHKGL
jgi:hypothetical protein